MQQPSYPGYFPPPYGMAPYGIVPPPVATPTGVIPAVPVPILPVPIPGAPISLPVPLPVAGTAPLPYMMPAMPNSIPVPGGSNYFLSFICLKSALLCFSSSSDGYANHSPTCHDISTDHEACCHNPCHATINSLCGENTARIGGLGAHTNSSGSNFLSFRGVKFDW